MCSGAAPRKYADQGPKRLSRRRACAFNAREEVEINFDFFSGTCTSAALYGLRTNKNARFVCVDRDHSWQWVCRHIPRKYRARILYIKTDVLKLTMGDIIKKIKERWPSGKMAACEVGARIPFMSLAQPSGPWQVKTSRSTWAPAHSTCQGRRQGNKTRGAAHRADQGACANSDVHHRES